MSRADLPEGFTSHSSEGVAWIEHRLGDHLALFSLKGDPLGEDEPSLDLGTTIEGPLPGVIEARKALCRALGFEPDRVRLVRQVHGDRLLDLGGHDSTQTAGLLDPKPPVVEADGFLLLSGAESKEIPAIVTADCLPVAISGSLGVALLHLGWRGLATGLLEEAVAATSGSCAVIGPAIGPCCYEVGPPVFEALGLEPRSESAMLDLVSLATGRLEGAGVLKVAATGLCTSCEEDLLFSYRKDGVAAGRQMSLVAPGLTSGAHSGH